MSYSQNNEESIIENYFKKYEQNAEICTLLDIGANDGKTLSNSYACITRGWRAVLVEPSKKCFEAMIKNIKEVIKEKDWMVDFYNVAISDTDGMAIFHESGSHAEKLYGENHSLLSSLSKAEITKWKDEKFTETEVKVWSFKTLLETSRKKDFHLITIDAEGFDYIILTQIDLSEVHCKMLIVEYNGSEEQKYIDYCAKFGMKPYTKTRENLIFVK